MFDRMYRDPMERFFSKVVISRNTSCWVWTDHLEFGYGIFSIRGTIFRAHRFAYIIYKGAIEEGLVIDHLCRNKRCVNPDHLEAVTQSLNITRGKLPTSKPIRAFCAQGHPLSGRNRLPRGKTGARCRICKRTYSREWARIKLNVKNPYRV